MRRSRTTSIAILVGSHRPPTLCKGHTIYYSRSKRLIKLHYIITNKNRLVNDFSKKFSGAMPENFHDTIRDFEKGRYIFRSYIRRRTSVRQSVRTEKASKHKAISMIALCFFFLYVFCFLQFPCIYCSLEVEQLFR